MGTKIIKINAQNPEKDKIKEAASIIKKGELIIFPTDTVYGLGANALNLKAVRRIYEVKKRPKNKSLIVHIAKQKEVKKLVLEISPEASALMDKYWPGALTLIFKSSNFLSHEITANSKKIALRIPDHKIALSLMEEMNLPLTAPSANFSGKPAPRNVKEIDKDFASYVDLIIDGGEVKRGIESTIIDLTVSPPEILRAGALLSGSSFQRKVWETVRTIPAGETRSYQWIAQKTGDLKSARAVGQALKKNPFPGIIPCHRVIYKNGKLGGFSRGIKEKKRLLKLEKNAL